MSEDLCTTLRVITLKGNNKNSQYICTTLRVKTLKGNNKNSQYISTTLRVKTLKGNTKNSQYIVLKHNIPRVSNYALRNARRIKKNEKIEFRSKSVEEKII